MVVVVLNTVIEALGCMEPEKYEKDFKYKDAVDILLEEKEAGAPESFDVRQYRHFEEIACGDVKEIIESCAARLAPFDTPETRDFLSSDELGLNRLSFPNTALFVNGTESDEPQNLFAALMYTQLFDALYETSVQ